MKRLLLLTAMAGLLAAPADAQTLIAKKYFNTYTGADDAEKTTAFRADCKGSLGATVAGDHICFEDVGLTNIFIDCSAAGSVQAFDGTTSCSMRYDWPQGTGTAGDPNSPGCTDQTITRPMVWADGGVERLRGAARFKFKATCPDYPIGDPVWECTSTPGHKFLHFNQNAGRLSADAFEPTGSGPTYNWHLYNASGQIDTACRNGGAPNLADGNWHEIRMDAQAGSSAFIKLFQDGAAAGSPTCQVSGSITEPGFAWVSPGKNRNQRSPTAGCKLYWASFELWTEDPGPGAAAAKPSFRPRGGAGTLVPKP